MSSPYFFLSQRRPGGGSPGYDYDSLPADVGAARMHLRGSSLGSEGSQIAQWNDVSGNGYHCTQSGAAKPLARSSVAYLNNRPGADFSVDGSHLLIPGAAVSGLTEAEVFAVMVSPLDLQTTRGGLWHWSYGGANGGTLMPAHPYDNYIYEDFGVGSRLTVADNTSRRMRWDMPQVYQVAVAADDYKVWAGGVQVFTSAAANTVVWRSQPYLGASRQSSSVFFEFGGVIAEVVLFATRRTAAQRDALLTHFKLKYGTPANLSTDGDRKVCNVRGSDITGLAEDAPVEIWRDISGCNHHLMMRNESWKPIYKSNVGGTGKGGVFFDGVDDMMRFYDLMRNFTAGEAFFVLKMNNDPPTANSKCGLGLLGTGAYVNYPWTNGSVDDDFGSTTNKSVGNPTPNLTNVHLYNVESSSGNWKARFNGTQKFSTTTNTVGFPRGAVLGASNVSSWLDGYVLEFELYNYILSSSQRAARHTYYASEYGITIA